MSDLVRALSGASSFEVAEMGSGFTFADWREAMNVRNFAGDDLNGVRGEIALGSDEVAHLGEGLE